LQRDVDSKIKNSSNMSTNEPEQQEPFKLSERFAHQRHKEKGDSKEEYIKTRANNNADNIFVEFGSFTSFNQLLMVK
jgi:hypothetical protein